MLFVAEPNLGEEEKSALAEVIDSGWITMGERVREFERAFSAAHQTVDAIAVSSCTAGLHLAIEGLGLGPGDEILVPSLTFAATVNSVIYSGATPVFVDIESLNAPHISLRDAATKCTGKTKAVIVMHYAGYLVDREAWTEFAESRGLFLIEDCAHAAGARDGGALGDAAVFSFYGNKNMTTAEGGMVFARDPAVRDRIRQMRSHGMTSGTFQRLSSGEITYDITLPGYNYRMDELRAAIGLVQIRRLGHWNERRRVLAQAYRDLLTTQCTSVLMPFAGVGDSVHHILPVILPKAANRRHVSERLRASGVQTTVHYPPVHQFTWYRSRFPAARLPVTEEFSERELTLPLHPKLEERDVRIVVQALSSVLADEARRDDLSCPPTSRAAAN